MDALVVDLGAVEHDGVGPVAVDHVTDDIGLALEARCRSDEEVATAGRQALGEARDELAEKGVHQVTVAHRQHHADEVRPA
jgi:cell division ATPase FtsA